jgi:hypothetical protein
MFGSEFHAWLHDYLTLAFTVAKATILAMTTTRAKLEEIYENISVAHTEEQAYPETEQINEIWQQLITLAQNIVGAVDFFSKNSAATAAEKAAAQAVSAKTGSLHAPTKAQQAELFDAARDVSDALLQMTAELTTIRQLENVQTMNTLSEEVSSLIATRSARQMVRRGINSGSELQAVAEPIIKDHFEELKFVAIGGTSTEKAAAEELINWLNASFIPYEQKINARATENAKKKGEEKPEHKPDHKPDNRPEGVEPNEDGDEPGNSDNGGDSGNTGGDSGNSDNNQNPPSGGNGGSDNKPPNPESPD